MRLNNQIIIANLFKSSLFKLLAALPLIEGNTVSLIKK